MRGTEGAGWVWGWVGVTRLNGTPLCLHRYPITQSRPGCYGDRSSLPGVRSYGRRDPHELYDVYCFARELGGESGAPESANRPPLPNSLPDIIYYESHLLWVPRIGLKGKAQALFPLLFLSDVIFSDALILLGPKSAH